MDASNHCPKSKAVPYLLQVPLKKDIPDANYLFIVHMINTLPTLKSCPALPNIILYGLVLTRSSVMRYSMDLLPDTQNCGLRMLRKCRERFPRHRLQRKPLDSDPGMHPWCMTGSLTRGGGENIPGACATRNFAYLVRGPYITAVAKVNRRSVYKITPHAPPSRAVTMCIFCETDMEAILNIVYEFHPAPKLSPVEKCLNQYSA